MTEEELLELLGDAQEGYVQQAQHFRSGKLRIGRQGKKGWIGPVLSLAAAAALVVGLTRIPLREKGKDTPSVVAATMATEGETVPRQTVAPDLPVLEDWCIGILQNKTTFDSPTFGDSLTLEEYVQAYLRLTGARKGFAVSATQLDMDGDGQQELLISFVRDQTSGELTLLLGRDSGRILSQDFWGGISFLNRDGSYLEVGPTWQESVWYRLHRENGAWEKEALPDHPDYPSPEVEIMDWYDLRTSLEEQLEQAGKNGQ